MANLGNAWHIPQNPEPRLRAAMRDPVGEIVPGMDITILTGNQFQGGGNPGNQLQDGSSLFFKRAADGTWTELPLTFGSEANNNKYYSATIAADASREFGVGNELGDYLRVAYDDHDTTFLHADGTGSATTSEEPAARSAPFRFTVQDPARWGRWDPVFAFPNVAIHTHVLPNGRVLMWGRQDKSKPGDLDVHKCTPFVWDPKSPLDPTDPQNPSARPAARTVDTDHPKDNDGNTVNLFCSGHTFLPDGRLLVASGHNIDGDGLDQACTYTAGAAGSSDPGTWAATAAMRKRRWYPTATALPNSTVLVLSGSYKPSPNDSSRPETLLEVWDNGAWKTIPDDGQDTLLEFNGLPLFPRMHVASDGRVFMSGTIPRTQLLRVSQDVADPGGWTVVGDRNAGNRDYAPAVMYDKDKIVYIGGGNDAPQNATPDDLRPPTNIVEIIDLGTPVAQMVRQAAGHELPAPPPQRRAVARRHRAGSRRNARRQRRPAGEGCHRIQRPGCGSAGSFRRNVGSTREQRRRGVGTVGRRGDRPRLPLDGGAAARRQGPQRRQRRIPTRRCARQPPRRQPPPSADLLAAIPFPGTAPGDRVGARGGGLRRDLRRDCLHGPRHRQGHLDPSAVCDARV